MASESPWIIESPIEIVAHASVSIPLTIAFPWATTVSAVVDVDVYRGTTEVTSTVMPSGSHTASGNTITLKNLTALVAGALYIITIVATVDGITDAWLLEVRALDPKAKQ